MIDRLYRLKKKAEKKQFLSHLRAKGSIIDETIELRCEKYIQISTPSLNHH